MRTNGILLALSSLPSKYGIGSFGNESYEFIDLLNVAGIKIWQLLPGCRYFQNSSGFYCSSWFPLLPEVLLNFGL